MICGATRAARTDDRSRGMRPKGADKFFQASKNRGFSDVFSFFRIARAAHCALRRSMPRRAARRAPRAAIARDCVFPDENAKICLQILRKCLP
jgi:hypothetical protein